MNKENTLRKHARSGIPDIQRPQAWARLAAINPISSRTTRQVEEELKHSGAKKPLVRHESYLSMCPRLLNARVTALRGSFPNCRVLRKLAGR